MLKRRRRDVFWLVLGLLALFVVACSPAGGDVASQVETTVVVEDDNAAEHNEADGDTSGPGASEYDDDSASGEVMAAGDRDAEGAAEDDGAAFDTGVEEPEEETESSEAQAPGAGSSETKGAEATNEDGILTNDDRSERQRVISEGWTTDWKRHTVSYSELIALLPIRDGIPAIDDPQFVSVEGAAEWLVDNEPVIAFEENGDARAYPLQVMTYHEIVNDVVGDLPVTVTFCPLCNSAVVFDRTLDGTVYDFGTSGWLRHSDLVMYDRQTESLWQQFTGEGIVGEMAGAQLTFLPSSMVSFADFREAFPEGQVLSRETGFPRPYGENPYPGYDAIGRDPFAFVGVADGRLAAMERVITVSLDELDVAYPLNALFEAGVINDRQDGQDLVVFHMGGTSSALDAPIIALGEDVGATGVFDPNLSGEKLTFIKEGDSILDEQTGSTWNVLGQATGGPLAGETLAPLVHGDHFWFAWAAFRPETVIFGE